VSLREEFVLEQDQNGLVVEKNKNKKTKQKNGLVVEKKAF